MSVYLKMNIVDFEALFSLSRNSPQTTILINTSLTMLPNRSGHVASGNLLPEGNANLPSNNYVYKAPNGERVMGWHHQWICHILATVPWERDDLAQVHMQLASMGPNFVVSDFVLQGLVEHYRHMPNHLKNAFRDNIPWYPVSATHSYALDAMAHLDVQEFNEPQQQPNFGVNEPSTDDPWPGYYAALAPEQPRWALVGRMAQPSELAGNTWTSQASELPSGLPGRLTHSSSGQVDPQLSYPPPGLPTPAPPPFDYVHPAAPDRFLNPIRFGDRPEDLEPVHLPQESIESMEASNPSQRVLPDPFGTSQAPITPLTYAQVAQGMTLGSRAMPPSLQTPSLASALGTRRQGGNVLPLSSPTPHLPAVSRLLEHDNNAAAAPPQQQQQLSTLLPGPDTMAVDTRTGSSTPSDTTSHSHRHAGGYSGRAVTASEAEEFIANFAPGDPIPFVIDGYYWYCDEPNCYIGGTRGRFRVRSSVVRHYRNTHEYEDYRVTELPERDRLVVAAEAEAAAAVAVAANAAAGGASGTNQTEQEQQEDEEQQTLPPPPLPPRPQPSQRDLDGVFDDNNNNNTTPVDDGSVGTEMSDEGAMDAAGPVPATPRRSSRIARRRGGNE